MRSKILYSIFIIVVATLAMAPAVFGQDDRAAQILASSRKAIGGKTLDALRTLSVDAGLVRNLATMQISSDVELLLELPDKYLRSDVPNVPGVVASGMTNGFNGDKPLRPVQGGFAGGGAMVIRMGGGPMPSADAPKLSPEEQAKLESSVVRGQRHELSRLMLGWFAMAHPSIDAQYTFAGEAESSDGRAYVIDVKNEDGFSARLFIDQQTNLPLMLTYQAAQRQVVTAGSGRVVTAGGGHGAAATAHGGAVRQMTDEERKKAQDDAQKQIAEGQKQPPTLVDYTLYFDDWQPVDGVRFPRTIRRALEGETIEEWTINKVRINPPIESKKFSVKN
jgi:hypothetical protein